MRTSARLGLYGAGLLVAFAATYGIAGAVVPDRAAADWRNATAANTGMPGMNDSMSGTGMAAHGGSVRGLSMAQDGYLLSDVSAPDRAGATAPLSLRITGPGGAPLTRYTVSHDKQLHLIVVRSDGTHFRHVHPTMAADGVWSLPWKWEQAGTYRLFADFVPGTPDAPNVTLTRTVQVTGDYTPRPAPEVSLSSSVDGFDVTLAGELHAAAESALTVTVTRHGTPVTTLQPYLGAFGHLVALREGDLAYLHVHPDGAEPEPGDRSGPTVTFRTEAPTPGRYLLYLDFQVDGQVHTAAFTVATTGTADPDTAGGHPQDADAHDGN